LVIVVWVGSIWYMQQGGRLETFAKLGEAMTVTNVLFAGLGFVALIATVWFQRKQVDSAIAGMEEQSSHLFEQTTKMDQTLDILREQSAATFAAAHISGLSILISVKEHKLDDLRRSAAAGAPDPAQSGALEKQLTAQIADLESLLNLLRNKLKESLGR
jgi:hypothetical protein